MNLAEDMTIVIGQGRIVETIVEGTDKIEAVETIEEIKEETTDPESNLLLKVMPSAQQDSFQISLLMTFWYLTFYIETRKGQENYQHKSFP